MKGPKSEVEFNFGLFFPIFVFCFFCVFFVGGGAGDYEESGDKPCCMAPCFDPIFYMEIEI